MLQNINENNIIQLSGNESKKNRNKSETKKGRETERRSERVQKEELNRMVARAMC